MLRAAAGALEGHVLEEVGGAGRLVGLCARAGVDPYTHGGGLRGGVRLGGDGQPVRERRDLGEGTGVVRCRETPQGAL